MRITPGRQFGILLIAAVAVAAGFTAMGRVARHDQEAVGAGFEPPVAARQTGTDPAASSGQAAAPADEPGTGIGDILEPMAAQLADLLEHLRAECAAARRTTGVRGLSAATRCVAAGEAATSTIEFVRGTLASAAGRDISEAVRSRWTRDLDGAAGEIRSSLAPIDEAVGRALASGAPSPAAFRDLGLLRDRIDRLLAALNSRG